GVPLGGGHVPGVLGRGLGCGLQSARVVDLVEAVQVGLASYLFRERGQRAVVAVDDAVLASLHQRGQHDGGMAGGQGPLATQHGGAHQFQEVLLCSEALRGTGVGLGASRDGYRVGGRCAGVGCAVGGGAVGGKCEQVAAEPVDVIARQVVQRQREEGALVSAVVEHGLGGGRDLVVAVHLPGKSADVNVPVAQAEGRLEVPARVGRHVVVEGQVVKEVGERGDAFLVLLHVAHRVGLAGGSGAVGHQVVGEPVCGLREEVRCVVGEIGRAHV